MPESIWNEEDAARLGLEGLVYRSNLLGRDRAIANWGGGNTSMKTVTRDFRGRETAVLWVKGSGSDLATITHTGFTALRLDDMLPLFEREQMSDEDMVAYLGHCILTPGMPRPSIETLLHAFVPHAHIDHTHPDAVIAFCCTPQGEALTREVFGAEVVWVPYIRPGFPLARLIALALRDQPTARAVFMAKHGLVTWGDTARQSYQTTLEFVDRAATAINTRSQASTGQPFAGTSAGVPATEVLTRLLPVVRGLASEKRSMVLHVDASPATLAFVNSPAAKDLALSGAACPDHLVHTKPWPLWLDTSDTLDPDVLLDRLKGEAQAYTRHYQAYYDHHAGASNGIAMDEPFPRIILIPGIGLIATGKDKAFAEIAASLYQRAIAVMHGAASLEGFNPLTPAEAFGVEYWPLERYKLTLAPPPRELAGQVALVTGSASGIGRATALHLAREGAHVIIADLNLSGAQEVAQSIIDQFGGGRALAVQTDVTQEAQVVAAVEQASLTYGGLDIVVSNAGLASANAIEHTSLAEWERMQAVLSTGYFLVAREAFKVFKTQGRGGKIVFVASKNALAPGSRASAYSAAKAAELHLARCLAEEGGAFGIRVNSVCPDAVLEGSSIWNSEWRAARAREYGIPPEQLDDFYRKRNTLKVSIYPEDIAEAILFLVSNRASKTTGAVLTVDGGVPTAYVR